MWQRKQLVRLLGGNTTDNTSNGNSNLFSYIWFLEGGVAARMLSVSQFLDILLTAESCLPLLTGSSCVSNGWRAGTLVRQAQKSSSAGAPFGLPLLD